MIRAGRSGQSLALAGALAVAGACAALTAVSLQTLSALKYAYLAHRGASLADLIGMVAGAADIGFAAAAIACTGAAVVLEIRHRAVSRAASDAAPVPRAILFAGLMLWLGHAMLAPGVIATGDGGTHVARVGHLAAALRDGESLFWNNYFSGGGTLLQFTGPVFHWLAAGIAALAVDPAAAIKITASLARLLAAYFMYRLLRELGLGRAAAGIGALLYAGGFAVTYLASIRSTFPQVINIAAMPAILWCVERIRANGAGDLPAVFGLPLAGVVMIGNHPPTVIVFALWAGVFLAMRIGQAGLARKALVGLAGAAAATALMSAYFLVPFALEKQYTAEDFSAAGLVRHGMPPLAQLRNAVAWGAYGLGPDYSTYLGYTLLGCLFAGGALLMLGDRRSAGARLWWAALPPMLLSPFVFAAYVRHGIFTFFFASVMAAAGLDMILRRRRAGSALASVLLFGFLLESGPLAVQPWIRTDLQPVEDAGYLLAARAEGSRVLEVTLDPAGVPSVSVSPDSSPIQTAPVQQWRGPHKPDATKAANPIAAVLKLAEADLRRQQALAPATREQLAALNVGWVVGHAGARMGLPADWPGVIDDPGIGGHWRIAEATPAIAAGRLVAVPRPAYFDLPPFWNESFEGDQPEAAAALQAVAEAHQRMGVDVAGRQAAALLVMAPPPPAPGDAMPPAIVLQEYRVDAGRVRLRLRADRAGYVRLAHPVSAFASVAVNGRAVAPIADILNLIVLPIEAGESDIIIVGAPSRLRVACLWITGLSLALVVSGLCLALARQRRLRLRMAGDPPI